MIDPSTDAKELVRLARMLERLLARRRAQVKRLAELDQDIRTTRKFMNELTRPFSLGGNEPSPDDELVP